jgi:hypothetical protein
MELLQLEKQQRRSDRDKLDLRVRLFDGSEVSIELEIKSIESERSLSESVGA